MTNEEILKKAIEKAKKNGYQLQDRWGCYVLNFYNDYFKDNFDTNMDYYRIIFDHSFAKAFFGRKKTGAMLAKTDGSKPREVEEWELHIQQMVLCEDPIRYLKQFLNN
ncbi:MAG: hypothetical protein ACFFDI_21445 [Promethearchaeota archaeon]